MSNANIAEIQNLLNGFMHAMDTGDKSAYANCFLNENSTLEIVKANLKVQGKEKIGNMASKLYKMFSPAQHWEGNIFVKVKFLTLPGYFYFFSF